MSVIHSTILWLVTATTWLLPPAKRLLPSQAPNITRFFFFVVCRDNKKTFFFFKAVCNALQHRHPDAKVLYIATEQFVREFVQALRDRSAAKFSNYYRSADVLIVDDVQFLAGKDKIQEEFFHTFNSLHQANKQIIMCSDKPPRDIAMLEDRLKSRFAGGMSIDMQAPDFETRCAIIQTKSEGQHSELEPEGVEYLA